MTRAALIYRDVVIPGLDLLERLGGPPRTRPAETLLVAISGQEANWSARKQYGGGPARGLWQFERGGGVAGVLTHPASRNLARTLCAERGVSPDTRIVHERLAEDDQLACGFARLLLWTDPRPLPDSEPEAWSYYLRNWRPGKPHPKRWPDNYRAALEAVLGAGDDGQSLEKKSQPRTRRGA